MKVCTFKTKYSLLVIASLASGLWEFPSHAGDKIHFLLWSASGAPAHPCCAGAALPPCSFCAGDSSAVVALTWGVRDSQPLSLVLLRWSLVTPQPSWGCARAAVPLPALNYRSLHSVFSSTAQALWKCFKAAALGAVKHLHTRVPAHSGSKRIFCLFSPSNSFADIILWACPSWHKKDFGWTGPGESEPAPSPHPAAGDSSWEQLCSAGLP